MKKQVQLAAAVAAASTLVLANHGFASAITPGDLIIYQTVGGTPTVGASGVTGSSGLSSAAAQVYLDEYTPAGTFVQAIAVNSTVPMTSGAGTQYALTASGSATTEGQITLSPDGQYVALTGYNAAVGTTGITSATAATVNRTVGILTVGTGAVDTSTALTNAYSESNIRGAVTTNGTAIYTVGASNSSTNGSAGLFYTTIGSDGGETQIATDKDYSVQVYNKQLYLVDDTINTNGIYSVPNNAGSLPTSSAVPVNVPNTYTTIALANKLNGITSTTNPEAFSLLHLGTSGNDPDTAYMADSVDGLIEKFNYSGPGSTPNPDNTPSLTLNGTAPLAGVLGLTTEEVTVAGITSIDIFATTSTGLYELTDSSVYGETLSGTPTLIASAPHDSAFRGVVADQVAAVPEPASLSLLMLGGVSLLARRRRRA